MTQIGRHAISAFWRTRGGRAVREVVVGLPKQIAPAYKALRRVDARRDRRWLLMRAKENERERVALVSVASQYRSSKRESGLPRI